MSHIATPRWRHPPSRAPRRLRPWLTDRASLTARLRAHFPAFRVKLLRQGWAMPNRDELAALGMPRRQLALVREVLLLSGDQPLVFAHSVMPRQALFHGFGGLRRQGNKPLGATLFANKRVKRSNLAFRQIDRRHPLGKRLHQQIAGLPVSLWARRSRFELAGACILVTELFLPPVLAESR